ncbi:DUF6537 domain-containing protein [Pseudomonas sp. R5(2019)]|uniref:DUF6537 domain-containing protein n=1 Tax=Pseudomonas sp. R5(2019) TaxID=2697566 RepID=UPI0015B4D2B6|nr:DUF6537 domain-containing protein [Pseudomonas sp. R5(2019)]
MSTVREVGLAAKATTQRAGVSPAPVKSLDEVIETRRSFLVSYQSTAYAKRYLDLLERVRSAEQKVLPGRSELTQAVAKYYFKLLAIKDEYEVARLHVESGFLDRVSQQFEGDYKLVFNLAPPLFARRDADTGLPKKTEFGPWIVPVFRVLAKLRVLRGTPLDVFGYTDERRQERALVQRYEAVIAEVLSLLEEGRGTSNYDVMVELAALPEQIRGYGHVRAKSMELAAQREAVLLDVVRGRVITLKKVA